jgi:hypothetical protein
MAKTVDVTVYELRWEGTTEVYVGSTVLKLSRRLIHHRSKPCACYAHLDINKAQIVPVLTYTTSDRCNRRPEAAHKALLRSKNIPVLADPNDSHNTPLWHTAKAKVKIGSACKGKNKGDENYRYAPFTVTWPAGTVDRWDTQEEAAPHYGVSQTSISHYLRGTRTPGNHKRSAHLLGTIWQYV